MENRPKSPSAQPKGGHEGEGTEPGNLKDQTPLPNEAENWSVLGATRIVPADAGNTEIRPDDTALPGPALPESDDKSFFLGDFRLLKKIGEGAMGAVYKAHQTSFNREVALKVLFKHVASNPKLVERLNREARTMGRLDHPNIVRGYGVGEDQGWQYVAMEFVDGETLQKWLGRFGRCSLPDSLLITLTCARALQYAHENGLVHRDIKPDNILITRQGDIKVADLGMVKDQDEEMSLTQTGHAVGTPWYMPLEQAKNAKDIDCRCDIYALGCMLYCLLTGQPPFSGHTLVEVIEAKNKGTFRPARQVNPEVPDRLDLIISKMTAKLPRDRYQSCADVIKDLEILGLAGKRLSFLEAANPRPPLTAKKPIGLQTMAGKPPGPEESPVVADLWYLRFHNADNQMVIRKLSTAQILQLLESTNFDAAAAKVSRQPREGFRALATYKEFEHAALARVAKSSADEKTVRYRNLYKKIEEQERQRERPPKETDANFTYWMGISIKVGGISLAIGLVIFLLWYFGTGLGK